VLEEKAAIELEEMGSTFIILTDRLISLKNTNKEVNSSLSKIKKLITGFPDELQGKLREIKQSMNSSAHSSSTQQYMQYQYTGQGSTASIRIPAEILTFEEAVTWYINNWFDNIINELRVKVISPTLKLEEISGIGAVDKLDSLSANAINKIKIHINNIDPVFWHTYTGKGEMATKLNEILDELFNPIYIEISLVTKNVSDAEKEAKENIESKKLAIDEVNNYIKSLETRIKSIESPIGKIPINLVDFIQLFPVLILILIFKLTNYTHKCQGLATALRKEFNKNKMNIQYLTSCWFLSPFRNIFHIFLLSISILVIVGIYILSVLHVIHHPEMFISFTGAEESVRKNLFYIAYGIGILIFIGCFWYIQKQIKSIGVADNNQL
jgi:hypothetical protein